MTESEQSQAEKGLPPERTVCKTSGEAVIEKPEIHSGLGEMEFFNRLLRARNDDSINIGESAR